MPCCTDLATIEKTCGGGNSNGLRTTIYVACTEHISAIAAATNHVISTDITMVADTGSGSPGVFYEWAISKVGASYTAEPQGEAEDGDYLHTLSVFIRKMDATKQHILNSVIGGEYVVGFTDRNDLTWLLGNLTEGAQIAINPATNDRNGYTLTITWNGPQLLYNYTGTFSV